MKFHGNSACPDSDLVQNGVLFRIAIYLIIIHVTFFLVGINHGMASEKERLATYPSATDRILAPAARWVQQKMPSLISLGVNKEVDFIILEYPKADIQRVKKEDYTDSCKERTKGVERPLIYCNALLFYEIEAVLRSFLIYQASPRFMTDEGLYALVRRIQRDPMGYLGNIRTEYLPSYKDLSALDKQIMQHMKLIMLFFVGHELSHIKGDLSGHSFTSLMSPEASLEKRIPEAVVKMCRHAEEFDRLGFGLPGFQDVVDIKSELRKPELAFRDELQTNYETCSQWYKDEVNADQDGSRIILNHLSSLDKVDRMQAMEAQHLFNGGMYFTGIYYLYKDLYNLFSKACGENITNTQKLIVCMMRNRESYVKASSIFGVNHPFPLLRSLLAIEAILDKRTDYFRLDPKKRTIWPNMDELEKLPEEEAMQKFWYYSDLQKYCTLAILMDTPIKLAHVGCSTGYLLEIDKKRGTPQALMMMFEPMEQAIQRLRKFQ